jgi:DMSO/TMAO reductase YedYZ molybdopterin-dependent catalytic subunit
MGENACEIVLEGADQGAPNMESKPPGQISYARSLPRDKAIQRGVLIAYQMNGRDLPQDHGYPVSATIRSAAVFQSETHIMEHCAHIQQLRSKVRPFRLPVAAEK